MNKVVNGTDTLTDNWLLQSVAEFLSGNVDYSKEWGWIWSDQEGVYNGLIKAGALQIDCLNTILEQILFANSIYVMKEWLPVWKVHQTDLNLLHSGDGNSIIKELSVHDNGIREYKERWLNDILITNQLKDKYEEGMEKFSKGEGDFWSQILNGVAEYLSLSTSNNLSYAPHSVRAGFLKSTLWFSKPDEAYPSRGIRKFNSLIDSERIQLSKSIGYDSTLINLNIRIPSGAMLCIQESSDIISPIKVALQLRENKEIKSIRAMIHELSEELIKKGAGIGTHSTHNELLVHLENDILKAAKLLSMSEKSIVKNQVIRQYRYEKYLDKSLIHKNNTICHSGLLMDLIDTGNLNSKKIIEEKFKIKDHQIFKQLIEWNDSKFFSRIKKPNKIAEYKVHIELNGDNNVLIGPDGKILNSQINQTFVKNNTHKNNPWISGSFYLVLTTVIMSFLAALSNMVNWTLLPIILIGGILIIALVGILQLRNDDKLKGESFKTLLVEILRRLPLLNFKKK